VEIAVAPRLNALTGIRMLAALAVFNLHVGLPAHAPAPQIAVAFSGHDWMTMFFILSGLILTWNYDDLLQERLTFRGLRTYLVARFARIYPMYLLALLLVALTQVHNVFEAKYLLKDPVFWLHVFALQAWSPDVHVWAYYNPPAWSIGVEFFLYALLPLLLLVFGRLRSRPVALLVIAVCCVLAVVIETLLFQSHDSSPVTTAQYASDSYWLYSSPVSRIPDFVLGICLSYLIKHFAERPLVAWGRAAQIVGAGLTVGLALILPVESSIWSFHAVNMVPFALVLAGVVWAPDTVLARFLGSRFMVFLGEVSFEFYLLHALVLTLVGTQNNGYVDWASTWLLSFVISLAAATGAHILIGRPLRSLLRRLLDPQRRAVPAEVAATTSTPFEITDTP
jgi:peptidoglycan/LPS O-acetylase OafA/YrhL